MRGFQLLVFVSTVITLVVALMQNMQMKENGADTALGEFSKIREGNYCPVLRFSPSILMNV